MPVRARTNEDGSGILNESLTSPPEPRTQTARALICNFVYWCSFIYLSQLSCLSCGGGNNALDSPSSNHHHPQHVLGRAASLLEHDPGAWVSWPSPALCVMKAQGPSSGLVGKTDSGWDILMQMPTKGGVQIRSPCSRMSKLKGWGHQPIIYSGVALGLNAKIS